MTISSPSRSCYLDLQPLIPEVCSVEFLWRDICCNPEALRGFRRARMQCLAKLALGPDLLSGLNDHQSRYWSMPTFEKRFNGAGRWLFFQFMQIVTDASQEKIYCLLHIALLREADPPKNAIFSASFLSLCSKSLARCISLNSKANVL